MQVKLEDLTDEQLKAIEQGGKVEDIITPPKAEAPKALGQQKQIALEDLTDEQLYMLEKGEPLPNILEEPPGMLEQAGMRVLEGVGAVGRAIDAVTGAPTRAAIKAAREGESPLSAFVQQFGQDPSKAESGKEAIEAMQVIDEKAGQVYNPLALTGLYSDLDPQGKATKMSPEMAKETLGFAYDVTADWTNVIPPVFAARVLGKGIKAAYKGVQEASKFAVKGSMAAEQALTGSRVIESSLKKAQDIGEASVRAFQDYMIPKQVDDFEELTEVARRHGITVEDLPEGVEFGPDAFATTLGKSVREGPAGADLAAKFRQVTNETREAVENYAVKISGGDMLDADDAGRLIQQGFDNAVERTFSDLSDTYLAMARWMDKNAPAWAMPEELATKLEDMLDRVAMMQSTAITKGAEEQAEQLFKALTNLSGAENRAQFVNRMQEIGKQAYQTKYLMGDTPIDVKAMREIYDMASGGIKKDVYNYIGKEAVDDLERTNKLITDFFGNKSKVARKIEGKSPEKVFNSLIKNGSQDEIEALKSLLTKEEIASLKGAFIKSVTGETPEGVIDFGFKSLYGKLNNQNKKAIVKTLFEPEEIQELGGLLKLGYRMGNMVLSTSGTGASNVFSYIGKQMPVAVANRNILELVKGIARGQRQVPKLSLPSQAISRRAAQQSAGFSRMRMPQRTRLDNILKAGQIEGARQESQDERRNLINDLRGR